jgi:hypothetical protein
MYLDESVLVIGSVQVIVGQVRVRREEYWWWWSWSWCKGR